MRKIVLFIVMFCSISVNAQIWKYNIPQGNEKYSYKVSKAKADTEEEAINMAIAKILYQAALSSGVNVQMDSIRSTMENGSSLVVDNITVGIPINMVCYETSRLFGRKGYKVVILCQVGRKAHSKPDFKPFDCSTGKEIVE